MTENKKIIMDAEYGIDSRYKSNKERESDAAALMEARLMRMRNLSKGQTFAVETENGGIY